MKKLQRIIFKWNFLFSFMLFFVLASGIIIFFVNSFIDFLGSSRVDLLKQVSERSNTINKAAETLATKIYSNTSYDLIHNEDMENTRLTQTIGKIVTDYNYYFDGMEIDLSAVVLMKNGYHYLSPNELTTDIRSIWLE